MFDHKMARYIVNASLMVMLSECGNPKAAETDAQKQANGQTGSGEPVKLIFVSAGADSTGKLRQPVRRALSERQLDLRGGAGHCQRLTKNEDGKQYYGFAYYIDHLVRMNQLSLLYVDG